MPYFGYRAYSGVQYGIISWGIAARTDLKTIQIRLNQILRVITFCNIQTSVTS